MIKINFLSQSKYYNIKITDITSNNKLLLVQNKWEVLIEKYFKNTIFFRSVIKIRN